jgi:hypothetical protein
MNPTVKLNCKAALGSAEVDDERTDWMLPAELHSIQSPSAQLIPQHVFHRGLAGTQISRCGNVVAMLAMASTHGCSFACLNSRFCTG